LPKNSRISHTFSDDYQKMSYGSTKHVYDKFQFFFGCLSGSRRPLKLVPWFLAKLDFSSGSGEPPYGMHAIEIYLNYNASLEIRFKHARGIGKLCFSLMLNIQNIFTIETSYLDHIKLGKDLFDGRRHVVELRFMKNLILVRVNLHF